MQIVNLLVGYLKIANCLYVIVTDMKMLDTQTQVQYVKIGHLTTSQKNREKIERGTRGFSVTMQIQDERIIEMLKTPFFTMNTIKALDKQKE